MRLAIVSFTERGSRLNASVSELLERQGFDCESFCVERYAKKYALQPLTVPLRDWTGRMFLEKDALLFIGATGIAVRSVAPFLEHKAKDAAVAVMDERGVFAISLLSGHLGGANELAGTLANLTGAIPVITTATDVNGRFAVDIFAKKNHLCILDLAYAKAVSADVLDEKQVGFCSDFPVIGEIPKELVPWDETTVFEGTNGICVTLNEKKCPYKQTLRLIPKIVSVGVGCRKETDAKTIEKRIRETLNACGISLYAVEKLASIDLKAQEPGILEVAEKWGVPFATFRAEELQRAPGEFTGSEFVESVTGVSNVCERSAVLASGCGRLIQKKTAADAVTVAAAVRDWSVEF